MNVVTESKWNDETHFSLSLAFCRYGRGLNAVNGYISMLLQISTISIHIICSGGFVQHFITLAMVQ